MAIRAIIRDILGIYVGYELVRAFITNDFSFNTFVLISGIILLVFGIWFLLERIGLVRKLT